MTTQLGRRALAGAAALLPAGALIGSAHAQTGNESTFDRIRRTKTLRIAALPGELPYFQKDITSGEWSGACIDMAKDIAKVFDAQLAWAFMRGYGIRGLGNTRAYVWCNKVVHIRLSNGDVFLGHNDPERIVRDLDMVTGVVTRG